MRNQIASFFPTYGVRNIRYVYIAHIFLISWFAASSWVFYAEKYVSLALILVVEIIAMITGMAVEVPSGAIADLFGRKQSAAAGFALKSIGSILFLLGAFHGVFFLIGRVIVIAGVSLVSGSLEAITYDSLAEARKENFFDQIWGKAATLSVFCAVVAIGSGGLLWVLHPVLPMTMTAFTMGCGALVCLSMREPTIQESSDAGFRNFLTQTSKGFHILFSPRLRWLSVSLIILGSGFTLSINGALRTPLLETFTYDGETLGYGIAFALLVATPLLYVFGAIRQKMGDRLGIISLLVGSAAFWILAGVTSNSVLLGGIFLCGTAITRNLSRVWISTILNEKIDSQERATVLSTLTFVQTLPYVCVVIFLSVAGKAQIKSAAGAVAVMMLLGLVSYLWSQAKTRRALF